MNCEMGVIVEGTQVNSERLRVFKLGVYEQCIDSGGWDVSQTGCFVTASSDISYLSRFSPFVRWTDGRAPLNSWALAQVAMHRNC